jgi:AcrR family transcriptional regulator
MSTEELGLRERKKARTRELIIERAMALFDERGFEQVTIADIAAAADIAPRTFFSYFPSKDAVVYHDFDDFYSAFRARVQGRPDGVSTLDVLRAFVADVLAQMDPADPVERCRRRVIDGSAALQQHDRELIRQFEQVLADGLAEDLGVERDSPRARVAAAAAAGALEELERVFDKRNPPADPMAAFDEVFAFVRGGLDALATPPR